MDDPNVSIMPSELIELPFVMSPILARACRLFNICSPFNMSSNRKLELALLFCGKTESVMSDEPFSTMLASR